MQLFDDPFFFFFNVSLQASEQELLWVIRSSVLVVGLAGTGLAFVGDSVFELWLLSGDLVYCILLPQLVCVIHLSWANSYGAISGYVGGMLLRGLSGEPALGIPPLFLYPGWKEENGIITQYFPFRTLAMVSSLLCIVLVSWLVQLGFKSRVLPQTWDVLHMFEVKEETEMEPSNMLSEEF